MRPETDTIYEQPSISIKWVRDRTPKEASERDTNIHYPRRLVEFPKMKIGLNLAPGDIKKKRVSTFDLGKAVGLLMQSNQFCAKYRNK